MTSKLKNKLYSLALLLFLDVIVTTMVLASHVK